ncbi:GNAT family N-acetyltransferase [bacterium]|nr:GNAT family N-acetyltransferase [bacterium]
MKTKAILCLFTLLSILSFNNTFTSERRKTINIENFKFNRDIYDVTDIWKENEPFLGKFTKKKKWQFLPSKRTNKIAISQDKTVGFICYNKIDGFISAIAVANKHKNCGYGTALIKNSLADLFSHQHKKVVLGVFRGNIKAIKFYKKLRFLKTDKDSKYFFYTITLKNYLLNKKRNKPKLLKKVANKKQGATIVMITHDEHVAKQASRIIRLHDGKVVKTQKK